MGHPTWRTVVPVFGIIPQPLLEGCVSPSRNAKTALGITTLWGRETIAAQPPGVGWGRRQGFWTTAV